MWRILGLLIWLTVQVLAKSPTGSYAPGFVNCPLNKTLLREGDSISDNEKEWIKSRQIKTNEALVHFLKKTNLLDFDPEKFVYGNSSLLSVNLGLAFSGGSYRAMLSGAGQLAALDNRTYTEDDGLSGILQAANYIAALSGGSWMLGSLAMQNWPSVDEVVFEDPNDVWNLTSTRQLLNQKSLWTIVLPVVLDNWRKALSHMNNYDDGSTGIKFDIEAKEKAGFETTLTDYWARGLAYQLAQKGNDDYGASATFSDIRNMSSFLEHDMPFPIVNAVGRRPGSLVYNINSTVVEFNPFEMGSFDPSLNSFTDIKYIGSNVTNGLSVNGKCVEGFDNAGFIMGTSSSLFNEFKNTLVCDTCNSINPIFKFVLKYFLNTLSAETDDVAHYSPNPFYKSEYSNSSHIVEDDTLYLIDGGLGGEVIPLSSLATKERALDVILAFDNSNDNSFNWPIGASMVNAYERQFYPQGSSQVIPYVPDTNSFLEQNLTAKPTFFGCDASNLTDLEKDGVIPPLIVYIANRPDQYFSNFSNFDLTYTDEEKKALIQNGFDTATFLNGTVDADFPKCIACALIRREQERRGEEQTNECKECFKNYCWDGTISNVSSPYYAPLNFTDTGLTNDTMELQNSIYSKDE